MTLGFYRMGAASLLWLALCGFVEAQGATGPLYRVFLTDGTTLVSYGEWARVDNRLVFSMPVVAGSDAGPLHLVSIPTDRVDWRRTDQYANAVRAKHYAATRGDEDFARLNTDVAKALNDIALLKDPREQLRTAERARHLLAAWPISHYGYRAREVHEFVGVLDEVISGLRASAGLGTYNLSLLATTPPPPDEALLPAPEQSEIVQQLMTAAAIVDSPIEKVSLLQTVVGILDRAVDLLPESWAATIRTTAVGTIAEEQKIDSAYAKLRDTTLTVAQRLAGQADVRGLERLRIDLQAQDEKLGRRRSDDVIALSATIEAQLEAAHRLRLAQDQWILRGSLRRAYQRATGPSVATLTRAERRLQDIRSLAGPAPWRLKPLVDELARETRILSRMDPPAELLPIHAIFRSACELALNAARLRLSAVELADLGLAQQASSAAAGSLMLLAKAKADLDAALRPPILAAAAQ